MTYDSKTSVPRIACVIGMTLASAAALGQSSVELYGNIDMGVSKSSDGTSINPGVIKRGVPTLQQGASSTLGFRGREDLGGGMYARFDLGHRFLPDTGAPVSASSFFASRSIVALGDSKLGEVYLGRDIVPAWLLAAKVDRTYWQYVSQLALPYSFANFTLSAPSDSSAVRRNSTTGYRSPVINGFSAQMSFAQGNADRPRTRGFNVIYDKDGVYAGVGYDGRDSGNRLWIATLGYQLAPGVDAVISTAQARGGINASYEGKSYAASLGWTVGVHRQYVQLGQLKTNAASSNKSTKFGLGEEYFLSKRTSLYVTVGTAKTADKTRSNAVDFGVNHRF